MDKTLYSDYTIADMAKQLGMTTEGVRYYEKQGIVSFRRNPETGRSVFRSRCVTVMRFVRMYNALGIRLSDIQAILASEDCALFETAEKLDALSDAQTYTVWRENRLLDRIHEHKAMLGQIAAGMPKPSFGTTPAMCILPYGNGKRLRDDAALSSAAAAWQKLTPITFPVVICPVDALHLPYNACPVGLALEEDDFAHMHRYSQLTDEDCKGSIRLGGASCLVSYLIDTGDDAVPMSELLSRELGYIARRNMQPDGEIILKPVLVNSQASGYRIHHLVWIPVRDVD